MSFELARDKRLHVNLSISSLIGYHDPNGHYVAIAPNITHLVEQQMALQEMADIDALTGLLNRRSGQVALEIELQEAAGSGAPMSAAMGEIHLLQADQRPPWARSRRRRPAIGGSVAARRHAKQRPRHSLGW